MSVADCFPLEERALTVRIAGMLVLPRFCCPRKFVSRWSASVLRGEKVQGPWQMLTAIRVRFLELGPSLDRNTGTQLNCACMLPRLRQATGRITKVPSSAAGDHIVPYCTCSQQWLNRSELSARPQQSRKGKEVRVSSSQVYTTIMLTNGSIAGISSSSNAIVQVEYRFLSAATGRPHGLLTTA